MRCFFLEKCASLLKFLRVGFLVLAVFAVFWNQFGGTIIHEKLIRSSHQLEHNNKKTFSCVFAVKKIIEITSKFEPTQNFISGNYFFLFQDIADLIGERLRWFLSWNSLFLSFTIFFEFTLAVAAAEAEISSTEIVVAITFFSVTRYASCQDT